MHLFSRQGIPEVRSSLQAKAKAVLTWKIQLTWYV